MFPHIVKIDGRYLVRCLSFVGFKYMVTKYYDSTYWWTTFPKDWARFDTPEEAREAYRNRSVTVKEKPERDKFIGFL